jgi:hypothetical protein
MTSTVRSDGSVAVDDTGDDVAGAVAVGAVVAGAGAAEGETMERSSFRTAGAGITPSRVDDATFGDTSRD